MRFDQGEDQAQSTVRDLRVGLDLDLPSGRRVLEAARQKADHPLAYADAFAAATAMAHDATLRTWNPELVIDDAPWSVEDLRG